MNLSPVQRQKWRQKFRRAAKLLNCVFIFNTGMPAHQFDAIAAAALWTGMAPLHFHGAVKRSSYMYALDERRRHLMQQGDCRDNIGLLMKMRAMPVFVAPGKNGKQYLLIPALAA